MHCAASNGHVGVVQALHTAGEWPDTLSFASFSFLLSFRRFVSVSVRVCTCV